MNKLFIAAVLAASSLSSVAAPIQFEWSAVNKNHIGNQGVQHFSGSFLMDIDAVAGHKGKHESAYGALISDLSVNDFVLGDEWIGHASTGVKIQINESLTKIDVFKDEKGKKNDFAFRMFFKDMGDYLDPVSGRVSFGNYVWQLRFTSISRFPVFQEPSFPNIGETSPGQVPVPSTAILMVLGLAGFWIRRKFN